MRRGLLIGAISAALLVSAIALANNGPVGIFQMMRTVYGSPVRAGVIVSGAGASTTNATTGTPFTVTSGDTIQWACDAVAFCGEAAACSTTLAGANGCVPSPINATLGPYTMQQGSSTTTVACAGPAAFNCTFFKLK